MEYSKALHGGGDTGRKNWQAGPRAANPPSGARVLAELAGSLALPISAVTSHSPLATRHLTSSELAADYRACTEVIRRHSKSFYFSARLLPAPKRESITALYAFCRTSDDLIDAADTTSPEGREHSRTSATRALEDWTQLLRSAECGVRSAECGRTTEDESITHPSSLVTNSALRTPHSAIARAWADTRRRHAIPAELMEELLAGVRMDLMINRYETWDDLWLYCYRVASTVGLMSMYVLGARAIEAVPYAVQLGVALQLTNILRDVGEDARAGRIYLPLEEMDRFGYTEEMLMSGVVNRNFVALMSFQMARANALYESALPGIALLSPDSRLAVMAAAAIYRGILGKIVKARYDVFTRRAHLNRAEKLCALPAIWWRSRRCV